MAALPARSLVFALHRDEHVPVNRGRPLGQQPIELEQRAPFNHGNSMLIELPLLHIPGSIENASSQSSSSS